MNVLPKLRVDVCARLLLHRDPVPLSLVMSKTKKHPSNPMHMYNALYFLQHTCTKKLMSLSGYCVPVKCCMFLVSRITGWLGTYNKNGPQKEVIPPPPPLQSHTNVSWYQQVVQATFVLKHYTSNKKKYLVQGDIHKCKRMSTIVIPIHNHS